MPIRSLHSSVMRWPGQAEVLEAARAWLRRLTSERPDLTAAGVFGSYARGDAAFGSDLDLVIVLSDSDLPFERRAATFEHESLPVAVDLVAYTLEDWRRLTGNPSPFFRSLSRDVLWLVGAPESP